MAQRKFYNIPEGEKETVRQQSLLISDKMKKKKKNLRKHKDPNVYRYNIYIYKYIYKSLLKWHVKKETEGSPGGSVVKNPPINAGDMGLIPDLERSYMAQELRENPAAWEPQLWSPRAASTEAPTP